MCMRSPLNTIPQDDGSISLQSPASASTSKSVLVSRHRQVGSYDTTDEALLDRHVPASDTFPNVYCSCFVRSSIFL